jgi:hypothetical protein
MAKGRMISNTTAGDKDFNMLTDDTCRLAFLLLVPFADREGRTYGDPAMVRSMVFPRREDITVEMMEGYIQQWKDAGMIIWYEAKGDRFIWFPNFDKHQPGMRKEREPESEIPAPPAEMMTAFIRQTSGNLPEESRENDGLKEWNGIKENGMESDAPDRFSKVQRAIEEITGLPANPGAIPAIQEIVDMGAMRTDIQEGYAWLRAQRKDVKYYGTLVGPTRTAMARRVGKTNAPVAQPSLTEEELRRSIQV